MATNPSFAASPNVASAIIGTAETSLTVPAQASTVLTAGAAGTRIEEIVVEAVAASLTPATTAGLVYIFIHDGTTAHLYDTLIVSAVTASATNSPFRTSRTYQTLILETGSTLRASQSIAGNANLLKITVTGADF